TGGRRGARAAGIEDLPDVVGELVARLRPRFVALRRVRVLRGLLDVPGLGLKQRGTLGGGGLEELRAAPGVLAVGEVEAVVDGVEQRTDRRVDLRHGRGRGERR